MRARLWWVWQTIASWRRARTDGRLPLISNLVTHAKRELSLIGEDQDTIDGIVKVVQAFADGGHSGASAPMAIAYLEKLLKYQPLTYLTSEPAEWIDRSEMSGYPIWQSDRNPEAMSEDGGKTYWLVSEREAADSMHTTPLHTSVSQADEREWTP